MNKDWDAPWKTGAGMCYPGIGDRPIPWPSFGGQAFGGANPTCATCGGRARGARRCECPDPDWQVDGEPLEDSGVVTSLEQKRLFQAWCVSWLKECLRVLQPGGVVKIFGATRMYHRMCAAMEEAGFLLDPSHSLEAWGYGCLTEDTEVLTKDGWVHYHSAKVGTHILGFDLQTGQFDWQPVKETFEYPYDQGAFRLIGDGTDHIVSVQHRCVVQRDGGWVFVRAEELAGAEVVPCVWWSVHTEEGPAGEPGAVRLEPGSQAVRGAWDAAPSLAGVTVRVEPTHYTGIVWCVGVPTGAFIARRNGMAFVTGNSGFPKYLNTLKAINQHLGKSDERKVGVLTTEDAARFDGWATALKPGWEPFAVGTKPL